MKCLGYSMEMCPHAFFKHVPFKQTTPRDMRLKSKPWINFYIQKMMIDRLGNIHRTHSKETDDLHKKFRNQVVNNIKKSKVKYFHGFFLHKLRVT